MLSTIPNGKRAEISSTSPKATLQTISHHNPQLPGSESNNSKKNESLTALSFSNDSDGKVGDTGGHSKEEQTNPIFDDKRINVKTNPELEHHTNSKSIQIEKSTNNDRGILANCSANISDMSRRKQRNPKPTLFTSVEDSEHKEETSDEMKILKHIDQEMCVTNHSDIDGKPRNGDTGIIKRHNEHNSEGKDEAENTRSPYSSANSTSSSSPPPHDLSSMVKVEVHEGTSDIGHSMRIISPSTANPSSVGSRRLVSALEQSQNESPLGRSGGNSLPALIPMPSNYKSLMMTNNAFTMPGAMPSEPGTAFEDPLSISKMMMNEPATDLPRNLRLSGDELNLALKQNNMFHFGDVSVAHHPDNTPLPMIIPMVYLYPLPPSIDETGS